MLIISDGKNIRQILDCRKDSWNELDDNQKWSVHSDNKSNKLNLSNMYSCLSNNYIGKMKKRRHFNPFITDDSLSCHWRCDWVLIMRIYLVLGIHEEMKNVEYL